MTFASTAPAPDPTRHLEPTVLEKAHKPILLARCVAERRAQEATLLAYLVVLDLRPHEESIEVWTQMRVAQRCDLGRRAVAPRGVQLEYAPDARKAFACDDAFGHRGFPETTARMRPARDFTTGVRGIPAICRRVVGRSIQDVEHALGIGLHVATETSKHLRDRGAVLLRGVLEEDVVFVGDLHEVVPALASLALLFVRADGLHRNTGGVGGNAERSAHRFVARCRDDCRTECGANILDPSAHRAAVDGHAITREALLDAIQRQTVAVLVDHDVREHRRRSERTSKCFSRHRRGLEHSLTAHIERYVLGACDHEPTHATALPRELAALLKADALGLALADELLEQRVCQLHAHFFERQLLEIATACGAALLLLPAWPIRAGLRAHAEGAGKRVELGELVRKLQLQLRAVHALGLGHEDAALDQLQLQAKPLVRAAQQVTLRRQLRDGLRVRRALDSKRSFEYRNALSERIIL